jgi:hypothetical protein
MLGHMWRGEGIIARPHRNVQLRELLAHEDFAIFPYIAKHRGFRFSRFADSVYDYMNFIRTFK